MKKLILNHNNGTIITKEIKLQAAINAHVMWKLQLKRYIEGSSDEVLDPEQIKKMIKTLLFKPYLK